MNSKSKQNQLTRILLLIYIIILTWIILFKMALSVDGLPRLRNINLIPFGDSAIVNGVIDVSEIISNIIAFIPVGVYISMLRRDSSFMQKLLPIAALSFSYEVLQFVFRLGASDITDLLGNTVGGATGILIFSVLSKLFRKKERLTMIINGLALICTGLLIALMAILIVSNWA